MQSVLNKKAPTNWGEDARSESRRRRYCEREGGSCGSAARSIGAQFPACKNFILRLARRRDAFISPFSDGALRESFAFALAELSERGACRLLRAVVAD